jgi:hypothetical protein
MKSLRPIRHVSGGRRRPIRLRRSGRRDGGPALFAGELQHFLCALPARTGRAFIADVWGRLTGTAGACLSTLGPGATNLMTAVADALTRSDVLPSTICTVSAPRIGLFRGSMAGLCAPLSTLRRGPRGPLRMTRGRCGSLFLHRKGLAPSTPRRSPGASHRADMPGGRVLARCRPRTVCETARG